MNTQNMIHYIIDNILNNKVYFNNVLNNKMYFNNRIVNLYYSQ